MLSKEVSSTIFQVFGMTRPGIEPVSWTISENQDEYLSFYLLSLISTGK